MSFHTNTMHHIFMHNEAIIIIILFVMKIEFVFILVPFPLNELIFYPRFYSFACVCFFFSCHGFRYFVFIEIVQANN